MTMRVLLIHRADILHLYAMEELINQMRSKLSGGGQGQVSWSSSSFPRERRIPPLKSLSFKGAARSTMTEREPVRSSLRFSKSPEIRAATALSRDVTLQKRTTFADKLEETETPKHETRSSSKPMKPFPSMKEPISLADKKTQMKKPVTPSSAVPKKPRATGCDFAADAWEKAEIERIKERYDKLSSTILSWEQDKKKKSRAKLDRAESELSRKRSKALQKFKEEMEQINDIMDGAQAQAEERRRNEELKIREKANKYRATGELPRTCFCF